MLNIRIKSLPAPSLHAPQFWEKHLSAALRFQQGAIMYGYGYRRRREFLSPSDALDIIHENTALTNDDVLSPR
jgi:hypothetical protein